MLLLLLVVVLLAGAGPSRGDEELVVRVKQGLVRGFVMPYTNDSQPIYAFLGIPFARPPVNDLRFQEPEEAEPWTDIWNATAYGPSCIQMTQLSPVISGEEDCLYLNVFTMHPPSTWSADQQPVIVNIHGGGFVEGSGDMSSTRPDPLLEWGSLFVSMNYRLAVMGFTCTEDGQASCNAGLKDQRLALRWVRENIAAFGGDPKRVALMGESAGAASVHYQMLSRGSAGLFRYAISASGSALPQWAFVEKPRRHALALRRRWNSACTDLPEAAIVACLQRVNASDLVGSQYDVPLRPYENYFLKNTFLPCAESPIWSNNAFIIAHPEDLLKEGQFARIPYMTGSTSAEGIAFIVALPLSNNSRWAEVDEHFEDIFKWQMPRGLRTREMARKVRHFYLGNRSLTNAYEDPDTLNRFILLMTDLFITLGTVRSANLMSERGSPIYEYVFTRDGPIDFFKMALNATSIPGVSHGDDMAYVFDFAVPGPGVTLLPVPPSEQPIRTRQADLYSSMAQLGNPTPPDSDLLQWPLYSPKQQLYMQMDVELAVRRHPLGRRTAFWARLLRKRRFERR